MGHSSFPKGSKKSLFDALLFAALYVIVNCCRGGEGHSPTLVGLILLRAIFCGRSGPSEIMWVQVTNVWN